MNLIIQNYKIVDGLFVAEHEIKKEQVTVTEVRQPVNHIFCCDISGSMWDELPPMRKQLKNRLASIINDEDTVTIIAFADEDDCFVLKEKVHCSNAAELAELHKAINKYLTPMGCTDFPEPTKKSIDIVKTGGYYNWVFLSDGGHNCGPFSDVVKALKELQPSVSAATIIEYGYYADSERLSQMAEILGGSKIPASDFDHYVPVIESAFAGNAAVPKQEIDMPYNTETKLAYNFAVYVSPATGNVHVANFEDGKVLLPTNVDKFYTVARVPVSLTNASRPADFGPFYAIAYVLADKLEYDLVEDVLNYIGDKKFIDKYQTSFGKQKLFEFQNTLGLAVTDAKERGEIDPNYKPNLDPYSVVDFFNDIADDKDNLIEVASPDFHYNRTGAKSEVKVELTAEEQEAIKQATNTAVVEAIIKKANERKVKMEMVDRGYPISTFTWNEERANLSGLFKIDVVLTLPDNNVGLTKVPSFVYRNYTIIKDGIVNITVLPLVLTKSTFTKVCSHSGVKVLSQVNVEPKSRIRCLLDISGLTVINKKAINGCLKPTMTSLALSLLDTKFTLKYLKTLLPEEKVVETMDGYTQEQFEYLATLGITAKGYSPATQQTKDGDFYMATNFVSNFKSFSSVPKIADVQKKITNGKSLTPSETYMKGVMDRVDKFIAGTAGDHDTIVKAMIEQVNGIKDSTSRDLAQMKFTMLVARKWFVGSTGFDDNMDTIKSGYGLDLTIEYRFADKKVYL